MAKTDRKLSVLFAASECYPLIKTGGLGDVVSSLPPALRQKSIDVRVVLPAYRDILEKIENLRILCWMEVEGGGEVTYPVRLLECPEDILGVPLYLIDAPTLFDRPGNPYHSPDGKDWPDNAERYALFARAVSQMVKKGHESGWQPDIVHCHDWQTGLIPPLLRWEPSAPQTVLTIHNLAYSGLFNEETYRYLNLPREWWNMHNCEFYGSLSMLKAGIMNADAITTVSPSYAQEITTPEYGNGLEGVLLAVQHKLSGILNGIDLESWNPASDIFLTQSYDHNSAQTGKEENKATLLRRLGLDVKDEHLTARPLLGFIGRLADQKGIDLLLDVIPTILQHHDVSFVILGSGARYYEEAFHCLQERYPNRLFTFIGYDEALSHLIEAASDIFLMPSRFEPCGLNQLYSLRYGTPPVVYHTGGLADTVVNATPENLENGNANGFVFYQPTPSALHDTIEYALRLFSQPTSWNRLLQTGMQQEFGWQESASAYKNLYLDILN